MVIDLDSFDTTKKSLILVVLILWYHAISFIVEHACLNHAKIEDLEIYKKLSHIQLQHRMTNKIVK